MNLDNVTIEIRPRRPWEAVDLGMLMARRWWWQLTQLWLIISLPIFVLLAFLPVQYLWLQIFIVWWLKPLFERPLLFILSQTVFGEYPSSRDAIRAFPSLAFKQIIMSLVWRRLSPSRSLDLPVLQLENLRGSERSARLNILHREDTSPATWLTILGAHIEALLAMSIAALVLAFVPNSVDIDWNYLWAAQGDKWMALLMNSFSYVAMLLFAPFYVATGFALYLNRRVRLEAWDIEIAFKRIVSKRESSQASRSTMPKVNNPGKIVVSLLFALMFVLGDPQTLRAENEDISYATPLEAQQIIEEIKQGDEFNVRKTIKYIDQKEDEEEDDEPPFDLDLSWLKGLGKVGDVVGFVAGGAEYILWAIVILIILFVVMRYRHWLMEFAGFYVPTVRKKRPPKVLFGLEVTQESLPDDVGSEAKMCWTEGRHREALALLYRACLVQLIERGADLRDGDTEGVCLSKSKILHRHNDLSDELLAYFSQLTRMWQRFAYGHLAPSESDAIQLCLSWNKLWSQGGQHEQP